MISKSDSSGDTFPSFLRLFSPLINCLNVRSFRGLRPQVPRRGAAPAPRWGPRRAPDPRALESYYFSFQKVGISAITLFYYFVLHLIYKETIEFTTVSIHPFVHTLKEPPLIQN